MKVLFILPAIGQKTHKKYIGTWKMEPLTMATLKSITPPWVETSFFDDRIEKIDYDAPADLVAITAETYTAQRAYKIAARFREKGKKVLLAGYHVKAVPDEALGHADSIVVGNAEPVWGSVMEDLKNGSLKRVYTGSPEFSGRLPDRSIYGARKYLPLALIETGRGCPHNCEFCSISSYYNAKYVSRPIQDIVEEIKQLKPGYVFFVDDNICADREHLKALCRALIPLKIKWTSQASLTVARDPELLRLMKKSGCQVLLIGFESMDERNLDQMNKSWNYKLGERDGLINSIHRAGIGIYATFLFGFDFDDPARFAETVAFSKKHAFFFTAFNHLLPFPATPLYERLKREGRLLYDKWWLKEDYRYGDISYRPGKVSHIELKDFCADARRKFFSPLSILARGITSFFRNPDFMLSVIFFSQNFALMREIDEKLNLPIGCGLDESDGK